MSNDSLTPGPVSRRLYLIPSPLSEGHIPLTNVEIFQIQHLRTFLVEELKPARHYLKEILPELDLRAILFLVLDEHTHSDDIPGYFEKTNGDLGVISAAGCPCVADPGAEVVWLAHQKGWNVVPLGATSAIVGALMASGLNGQNFAFNGYLPRERSQRIKRIKELEARSHQEGQTQIFIETPYRNSEIFNDMIACLHPDTLVSLAVDLTAPGQSIRTMTVSRWRKQTVTIGKRPTIFLLLRSTNIRKERLQ